MLKMFESYRRKRNEQNNGSAGLPFNIRDNPEFEIIINDYVGEGNFTSCGYVTGVVRQQGYPEPCML
jgi:hypothetical protein